MATSADHRRPSKALFAELGYKYDVFLLHSGKNKEFVRNLFWGFCAKNVLPFFDQDKKSLRLGDVDADKVIMDALTRSSRFIMPIMSHEMTCKGWPEEELKSALKINSQGGKRIIIPVFYNIMADECGRTTNEYYKRISRIPGIERTSEDSDEDKFIRRVASEVEEELQETLKEELMATTNRPDGLDQNVTRDAQAAEPVRSFTGGSSQARSQCRGNAYGGDDQEELEQDAFYPLIEAEKQHMMEGQREHVDEVARHFTQKAVNEHLSANRKRIEALRQKTEEMRQQKTAEMRQGKAEEMRQQNTGEMRQEKMEETRQTRTDETSWNTSRSRSSEHSSDTFANNGSCDRQTQQSFSVQGATYAVSGHRNVVNVHHHYHGSQSTDES